jgi:hypothetical protein
VSRVFASLPEHRWTAAFAAYVILVRHGDQKTTKEKFSATKEGDAAI